MPLYMLDMGSKIYGDCILIVAGGRTVLVDGGHVGDEKAGAGGPSIPEQLAVILGGAPPFRIDLLVVTHCHSDHIGCLPELVSAGTLKIRTALLADPDLGFPPASSAGANPALDAIVRSLREEPRPELPRDALREFLSDAARLEDRYRGLVDALPTAGTKVVLYRGDDAEIAGLETAFAEVGMKVLGPDRAHLKKCREAIQKADARVKTAVADMALLDASRPFDEVELYRMLVGRPGILDDLSESLDGGGTGAPINNQSIMLKFEFEGGSWLLTGDMQLEKAEVPGLSPSMAKLLQKVVAEGPYRFVKAAHHGSYNGLGKRVLDALGSVDAIGISTGRNDPRHPHPKVLALLEAAKSRISWARTDKNGLVQATLRDGDLYFKLATGTSDDVSPNKREVDPISSPAPLESPVAPPAPAGVTQRVSDGMVEIVARIPHVAGRVRITVEIDGADRNDHSQEASSAPLSLPGHLPTLVFATDEDRLSRKIGPAGCAEFKKAATANGHTVVCAAAGEALAGAIRDRLAKDARLEGVVLVGGYDVVPSERYDALPPSLRSKLKRSAIERDPDEFVVWSDQAYGDRDGDGLADVPVSRVPDGSSMSFLRSALSARAPATGAPFGLRNVKRPFADKVFANHLTDSIEMLRSKPSLHSHLSLDALEADRIYLMLHGADHDTSRFWGEDEREFVEALRVGNVPKTYGGVVFSGCCFGALIVDQKANLGSGANPHPLNPGNSIALAFIAAGARAFVGCTGAHYSPFEGEMDYFGPPMHDAFWRRMKGGTAPAAALFEAKMDYMAGMPHGRRTLEERAIEHKMLRQFTCLGLGW